MGSITRSFRVGMGLVLALFALSPVVGCDMFWDDNVSDSDFPELGSRDDANPSPTDPNAVQIFKVGNDLEVFNGGTPPSFTTEVTFRLTEVWTYHWNGGAGAPAGTIALQPASGGLLGPWRAELYNGVYWVARPGITLPPGTYTVIDSDPATLAQNSASGGVGHAWAYGYVQ